LQGLKLEIDLIGFIGTAKVMPCYGASEVGCRASFSAAWKANLFS
jgi:hypothetical protein